VNPKKLSTSFTLIEVFYSLIALTLLFSIDTSSLPTTTPKIGISLTLNMHFDYLKQMLCFFAIFKNYIVLSSNFFLVLANITKSSM